MRLQFVSIYSSFESSSLAKANSMVLVFMPDVSVSWPSSSLCDTTVIAIFPLQEQLSVHGCLFVMKATSMGAMFTTLTVTKQSF